MSAINGDVGERQTTFAQGAATVTSPMTSPGEPRTRRDHSLGVGGGLHVPRLTAPARRRVLACACVCVREDGLTTVSVLSVERRGQRIASG